jgi:hypothetical protein
MTNLAWLQSITPVSNEQWHDELVIRVSNIEHHQFYSKVEKQYRAVINPADIKGISYAYSYNCFNDITWLELLNSLKRFDYIQRKFSSAEEIIEHVHNDYNETKTLFKFGEILITACGQHRMALAKFLKLPAVEVHIVEYPLDFDALQRYLLRKQNIEFLKTSKLVSDSYEVTRQNFDDRFISIRILGEYFSLDTECMDDLITHYSTLKKPNFLQELGFKLKSRLFIPRAHNEINSKYHLSSYSYLLNKHKVNQSVGANYQL